jgi:hypothetical protein
MFSNNSHKISNSGIIGYQCLTCIDFMDSKIEATADTKTENKGVQNEN